MRSWRRVFAKLRLQPRCADIRTSFRRQPPVGNVAVFGSRSSLIVSLRRALLSSQESDIWSTQLAGMRHLQLSTRV
jgi:hypothetical protein